MDHEKTLEKADELAWAVEVLLMEMYKLNLDASGQQLYVQDRLNAYNHERHSK